MATEVKIGTRAPDFSAPRDGGATFRLSSLRGQKVVLYFYPKDDTPGCTKEACGFTEAMPDFSKLDAQVVGVSKDSVVSHDKFKAKYRLPFTLVSDGSGEICKAYGVWVEKSRYGRTYMGIDRSTFLIDGEGKVRRIWRGVKVPGHVEEVLEAATELG